MQAIMFELYSETGATMFIDGKKSHLYIARNEKNLFAVFTKKVEFVLPDIKSSKSLFRVMLDLKKYVENGYKT